MVSSLLRIQSPAKLLIVMACATPSLAVGQRADGMSTVAMLRPGDALRVSVWNRPEWSGEFEVKTDSTLRHPHYNQVKVAGVPLPEVRSRIESFLSRFQNVPVEVEPRFKVTVAGEVRAPSVYSLAPETTVADAVAKAGGATERGRLDRVTIVRDGRETLVDLTKPETLAGALTIRSGDQVLVGRRGSSLREYIAPLASVASFAVSIVTLIRLSK